MGNEVSSMPKAKDISKVFKLVCTIGLVTCSVLKWLGVLGNADIREIAILWGCVYGIGAGTIDLNLFVQNIRGVE